MRPKVLYTFRAKEEEKDKKWKRWMLNSRKIRGSINKDDQKKYKNKNNNKRIELKIDGTRNFVERVKCLDHAE